MDCGIYFTDDTICPLCGGVVSKILSESKQSDTLDGYQCDTCKMHFGIEYRLQDGDYIPHPLYAPSKVSKLKSIYIERGKKK